MFCFIQHSLNTDTPISHIPSSKVSYQHSTHNSYLFVAVSTPQAKYIVANTINFFYFIFITLILYSHLHKIRSLHALLISLTNQIKHEFFLLAHHSGHTQVISTQIQFNNTNHFIRSALALSLPLRSESSKQTK